MMIHTVFKNIPIGSDLIEKIISRELHSDIKLDFAASGVRCRFLVPLRAVSPFAIKQPAG